MNILKAVSMLVVLSGALFLSACSSGPTTPPATTTGSIRITSVPTGARVFLDNVDKAVTTDCTLKPECEFQVKMNNGNASWS
jgi:hypothetical protein